MDACMAQALGGNKLAVSQCALNNGSVAMVLCSIPLFPSLPHVPVSVQDMGKLSLAVSLFCTSASIRKFIFFLFAMYCPMITRVDVVQAQARRRASNDEQCAVKSSWCMRNNSCSCSASIRTSHCSLPTANSPYKINFLVIEHSACQSSMLLRTIRFLRSQ